jgi:glycosyltransferase involved in cell wall biosynthesis
MKVTLITATFNSAKTLHLNLKSVERQSYNNIEHILIDNCSTDGTLEIAQTYTHISGVISEKYDGIYDAINKCIELATGDIIGILYPGSYLANEHSIKNIVSVFNSTNAQATYGSLIYVNKNKPEKINSVWLAGCYNPNMFYHGWMLPHPTFYVKKEVYETYGLYNSTFKYASDYEMVLRLLLKHKIKTAPMREVIIYMNTSEVHYNDIKTQIESSLEYRLAWETIGLTPLWYTLYLKPLFKFWHYILHLVSVKWLLHIPPAQDNTSFIYENVIQQAKLIDINS